MTVFCVAVDVEHDVEPAVALAAQLARRCDDDLALVDVLWPMAPIVAPAAAPGVVPSAIELEQSALEPASAEYRAGRHAELEELALRAGAPARSVESHTGPPADVLRELSRRPDARLLVVVDHGGGALKAKLLGEPGRDAMRDLACPIVLTPTGATQALGERPRIMCAVDDDGSAPEVAEVAGDLAERLGATLRIAHSAAEIDDELVVSLMPHVPPTVEVTFALVDAPPPRRLAALADQVRPDLIVVGAPHHGAISAALQGSVTHHLAEHAGTPLVVVPTAG